MLQALQKGKEELEWKTKATISWIQFYGVITPPSNSEKSDPFAPVSRRKKASPLPYILGIAGAVLLSIVALLFDWLEYQGL